MKKKRILLILPISFFLCSCNISEFGIGNFKPFSSEFWQGLSIFGWQPFGGKNNNDNSRTDPPIEDADVDENKHANSISADPSAPFYLKLNETRTISVSLSPAPTRDLEKEFTWKITAGDGISIPAGEKSNKIVVTATKISMNNVITVTNDYNTKLTKTFTVNVIDYDESKDYVWQYQSSDRAQFGYENVEGKKAGIEEGDAVLNGVSWHFTRSKVTSLQSSMGAIGFGKGDEPEPHVHLETENERTVNQIIVEAASANSLAKMTIKVGDTVYMDNRTLSEPNNKVIGQLVSDEVTPASGKIQIDIYTDDYDSSRKDDPTYLHPGAAYLKSMIIIFNESLPNKTISLVKNISEIVSGEKYFILGSSDLGYGFLDGSLKSKVKETPLYLDGFTFADNVEVAHNFEKYSFTADIDGNGKLNFTSGTNVTIGLTKSTSSSSISITTGTDKLLGWDYSIDSENYLVMTMTDNASKLKYFGVNKENGNFAAYTDTYYAKNGKIYLYKFANN